MTLLYRTAEWHAFAKLRLHAESTLQHLERLTAELGQLMRKFRDATQSGFVILELPKETVARKQRQKSGKGKEKAAAEGNTSGRKPKILNLTTYKWHALGDYVRTIRLFGGTDGFSTQVVSHGNIYFYISGFFTTSGCQGELAHKVVKRLYGSTNKRNAERQIAKRYQRLERARLAIDRKQLHAHTMTQQKSMDNKDDQVDGDSDLRYYISPSKNRPVDIFDTIRNNKGDPAYYVCLTDSNYYDC